MTATALAIVCRSCQNPLPVAVENSGALITCGTCSDQARIDLFPRIKPQPMSEDPLPLSAEDQATCYFHAQYQAEVPCDDCGRFLCRLCDIPFHGGHRCVSCIEQMQKKPHALLISSDVRWTYIAMVILLASIPLWFFSFISIPVALVLFLKFGRRKGGVLPPSTRETVMFILVALGVCGLVVVFWVSVNAAFLAS